MVFFKAAMNPRNERDITIKKLIDKLFFNLDAANAKSKQGQSKNDLEKEILSIKEIGDNLRQFVNDFSLSKRQMDRDPYADASTTFLSEGSDSDSDLEDLNETFQRFEQRRAEKKAPKQKKDEMEFSILDPAKLKKGMKKNVEGGFLGDEEGRKYIDEAAMLGNKRVSGQENP